MNELTSALPAKLTEMPQKEARAKNTLGKDDFLKLLMAQLNNQDPLKPMEHQEFSAQLAQFGSLEQLQNIHKGIEGLQTGIGNESKFSALGMIGKQVQAAGNEVNYIDGQPMSLSFAKKEGVVPIKATIYSFDGKLVREMDLDPRTDIGGVKWDGKDQDGKSLPSGKYTFRVQGVNQSGQAQELGTELSGRVTGVEMDGNNPLLIVQTASGSAKLEMGRVRSVMTDPETSSSAKANPSNNPEAKASNSPTNPSAAQSKLADNGIPPVKIDLSELDLSNSADSDLEARNSGFRDFPAFCELRESKTMSIADLYRAASPGISPQGPGSIGTGTSVGKIKGPDSPEEFQRVLKAETQQLNLSQHAETRIRSREIPWDAAMEKRVRGGMDSLQAKGSREALILADGVAFIANIKSRTIVTAMDQAQLKERVFTNIDSAVLV